MQPLMPIVERIGAASATTAATLAVWLLVMPSSFLSLVKLERMRIPYVVIFFGLLFLSHTVGAAWVARARWIVVTGVGAAIGHLAAWIAIASANLFIENGGARTLKTVEQFGLESLVAVDNVVAFGLGGWLFGGGSFALLRWWLTRGRRLP